MFLQANSYFEYIDLWSSPFTWAGHQSRRKRSSGSGTAAGVPVQGDFVVIPSHMTVLLDVSTPVFKMVLIQGTINLAMYINVQLNWNDVLY